MKRGGKHNPAYADSKELWSLRRSIPLLSRVSKRVTSYHGAGEIKSPFKTKGLDFQEVRAYQPGDDIRQIDWRVTAKHGKPFTKLYTEEKEHSVFLVVDMRSRMKFASQGRFKSVLAARIASFLAFMAESKNDKISFLILKKDSMEAGSLSPANQIIPFFINALEQAEQTDQNLNSTYSDSISLTNGIMETLKYIRRGSSVFFISDFHDFSSTDENLITQLASSRLVTFIHIYDPLESHLPKDRLPITNGLETRFLEADQNKIQLEFHNSFLLQLQKIQQVIQKADLGYIPVLTHENDLLKIAHFYRKDP